MQAPVGEMCCETLRASRTALPPCSSRWVRAIEESPTLSLG